MASSQSQSEFSRPPGSPFSSCAEESRGEASSQSHGATENEHSAGVQRSCSNSQLVDLLNSVRTVMIRVSYFHNFPPAEFERIFLNKVIKAPVEVSWIEFLNHITSNSIVGSGVELMIRSGNGEKSLLSEPIANLVRTYKRQGKMTIRILPTTTRERWQIRNKSMRNSNGGRDSPHPNSQFQSRVVPPYFSQPGPSRGFSHNFQIPQNGQLLTSNSMRFSIINNGRHTEPLFNQQPPPSPPPLNNQTNSSNNRQNHANIPSNNDQNLPNANTNGQNFTNSRPRPQNFTNTVTPGQNFANGTPNNGQIFTYAAPNGQIFATTNGQNSNFIATNGPHFSTIETNGPNGSFTKTVTKRTILLGPLDPSCSSMPYGPHLNYNSVHSTNNLGRATARNFEDDVDESVEIPGPSNTSQKAFYARKSEEFINCLKRQGHEKILQFETEINVANRSSNKYKNMKQGFPNSFSTLIESSKLYRKLYCKKSENIETVNISSTDEEVVDENMITIPNDEEINLSSQAQEQNGEN